MTDTAAATPVLLCGVALAMRGRSPAAPAAAGGETAPSPFGRVSPYRVGGVGVVPVIGPIGPGDSAGGPTVQCADLAAAVRSLANADDVRLIALDMDTPGGSVLMRSDVLDAIADARTKKPVWALAHDMAASLGYFFAAACDQVCATPSAYVGSIGAAVSWVDDSEMGRQMGLRQAGSRTSELKPLPFAPLTDAQRAEIEGMVRESGEEFFAFVAARRGMTADAVRGLNARLFSAAEAQRAGLVDRVETTHEFFRRAIDAAAQTAAGGPGALPGRSGPKEFSMSTSQIAAAALAAAAGQAATPAAPHPAPRPAPQPAPSASAQPAAAGTEPKAEGAGTEPEPEAVIDETDEDDAAKPSAAAQRAKAAMDELDDEERDELMAQYKPKAAAPVAPAAAAQAPAASAQAPAASDRVRLLEQTLVGLPEATRNRVIVQAVREGLSDSGVLSLVASLASAAGPIPGGRTGAQAATAQARGGAGAAAGSYEAAVKALMAKGTPFAQAVNEVNATQPELRADYVERARRGEAGSIV